jgi:hypothetical protein
MAKDKAEKDIKKVQRAPNPIKVDTSLRTDCIPGVSTSQEFYSATTMTDSEIRE